MRTVRVNHRPTNQKDANFEDGNDLSNDSISSYLCLVDGIGAVRSSEFRYTNIQGVLISLVLRSSVLPQSKK